MLDRARPWARLAGGFSLLLVAAVACPPASRPAGEPLERRAGLVRSGRLEAGGERAFHLELEAGEYLQAAVEQQGVDLVLALEPPGGGGASAAGLVVDTFSGADGAGGVERICWVARRQGLHRLVLRAPRSAGPFRLEIEALHPAGTADHQRARAEREISEAARLAALGPPERERSRALYGRARSRLRALGDGRREADVLFRLAELESGLGEGYRAIGLYSEALERFEAAGEERQIALTLHHRGAARSRARDIWPALADLEAAQPLWARVGDRRGEALTANELGRLRRVLGQGREALVAYDLALERARELADPRLEARVLHNRGRLYQALGLDRRARLDLEAALGLRQRGGERRELAATWSALGWVRFQQGELDGARTCFETALAQPFAQDAHARAIALASLARIDLAQGALASARARFELAASGLAALGDRAWQSSARSGLGRVALAERKPAEARRHFEGALALATEAADRSAAAEAWIGCALAARDEGRAETARVLAELALAEIEGMRAGLAPGGELRAELFASWQSYFDVAVELALGAADEPPSRARAAAGFALAERASARALLEAIAGSGRTASAGVPAHLGAEEKELARRVRARELARLLPATELPEDRRVALERELDELMRRHQRLREQILATDSAGASSTRAPHAVAADGGTLGVERIATTLLAPGEVLLALRLGERASHLWAVGSVADQRELVYARLPPRVELEAVARRATSLLAADHRRSRERARADLAKLAGWLLESVRGSLYGAHTLVFVLDGELARLPVAALPYRELPDGDPALLVERFDLAVLPSATALERLRERAVRRPLTAGLLAVVGDPALAPDAAGGHAALPGTGMEASTLLGLAGQGPVFAALGREARREVVIGGTLSGYRILHFATHGEASAEHPERSRLILAPGGEVDGAMYEAVHAFELGELALPAELVVLAACRTGLGRTLRGEGTRGLAHEFFRAGASRALVSLWDVGDEATAELMARFYRALLVEGRAPAAALRAAQNELLADPRWGSPVHWAGWQLQGDWRAFPLASDAGAPRAEPRPTNRARD